MIVVKEGVINHLKKFGLVARSLESIEGSAALEPLEGQGRQTPNSIQFCQKKG